jgi:hypothetical protein
MTSAAEAAKLGHAEFWDERYAKAEDGSKPTHEWFRDFQSLEPFFAKHLFETRTIESNPRILHLGSGDSVRILGLIAKGVTLMTQQTIPYDLLQRGYSNQLCLDFSAVVVDLMKSRHEAKEVEWRVGDVRDMLSVPDKSIDVAFDKGTLDAMIHGSPWSPPDEVLENTGRYMKEVSGSVSRLLWCSR